MAPLKRGEIFSLSLSEIFVLSSKDLRELQAFLRLGAPSFIRIDEKRWCQPSVWKGGRSFRPPLLPRRKARKQDRGQNKK